MEFLPFSDYSGPLEVVEIAAERFYWISVDLRVVGLQLKKHTGIELIQPDKRQKRINLITSRDSDGSRSKPSRPAATGVKVIYIEKAFNYKPLVNDFGPYDLPSTIRYIDFVDRHMDSGSVVIHISQIKKPSACANAAYLSSVYACVRLGLSPSDIEAKFKSVNPAVLPPFRDASRMEICTFPLHIHHFCEAVHASMRNSWIDWTSQNVGQIEKLQGVDHGDLNWIIEDRYLAFAGPSTDRLDEDGLEVHPPGYYARLFKKLGITDVVRLNVPNYDAVEFEKHGISHHDLFFEDGSCPPMWIVEKFLTISKSARGAIAVHCKAGLGRTGTLIGLAVMQEFKVPAHIYIAWARMARPGSVLGPQQHFLVEMEARLFRNRKRTLQAPQLHADLGSQSKIGRSGDAGQGGFLNRQKRMKRKST